MALCSVFSSLGGLYCVVLNGIITWEFAIVPNVPLSIKILWFNIHCSEIYSLASILSTALIIKSCFFQNSSLKIL